MTTIDASATQTLPVVNVSPRAAIACDGGVLWIFSNEIGRKPDGAAPGLWCRFVSGSRHVGVGYFNPHSLIAGRLVGYEPREDIPALLRERLEAAFRRRMPFGADEGRRLVFSEADFLPGLVIDVFGGVAVVQSSTAGIDTVIDTIVALVPEVFAAVAGRELTGLVVRADGAIRRLETVPDYTRVVRGDEAGLRALTFREGDATFVVDALGGQKTGFFLDQRENRGVLAAEMKSFAQPTVLDLFCYSGGWGLRALAAGAAHVTFVDDSADALALLEKALEANGVRPGRYRLIRSDVFDFLEADHGAYDVVVSDPPAFVKSRKNLGAATRAYERLNRAAWRHVKRGGTLVASSCSYHLAEADFVALLAHALGKERGLAHVVRRGSQAADHPVLLSMPETRYLKCLWLRRLTLAR